MNDNVNHPLHYTQGGIECIDAIKSATIGKTGIEAVCVANAIKYLWRFETKNGIEDVKKAQWYLNRLIQELEENSNITEYTEGDCCDCKFRNKDISEEPCRSCKNSYFYDTKEYQNLPLNFQPKD